MGCGTFFKAVKETITTSVYASTSSNANAHRWQAGADLAGRILSNLHEKTTIAAQVAQLILLTHYIFRGETHNCERLLHIFQFCLVGSCLSLQALNFFHDNDCNDNIEDDLCKALFIINEFYGGSLLATWIAAEATTKTVEHATPLSPSV